MKVLVVDDEPHVVEILARYLTAEGHTVVSALDGATALELFREEKPDFVVLDLMLPRVGGIAVCQAIRRESGVPILMLTGRAAESDRVVGLTVGADDYVTKPFSPREVIARIDAIRRRTEGRIEREWIAPLRTTSERVFPETGLLIDVSGRRAYLDGNALILTPSEFEILKTMAARPGRVYTRDELLERLRGEDAEMIGRAIDVHVVNLRRKLGDDPRRPRYLRTVRGMGYSLGGRRHIEVNVWEE